MSYRVTTRGADAAPLMCLKTYAHDSDPVAAAQYRAILRPEDAFRSGKERLADARAAELMIEARQDPPLYLPRTADIVEVTRNSRDRCKQPDKTLAYARYKVGWLEMRPITLSLPEGGGKTMYDDFTDYECQPFQASWTPPADMWREWYRESPDDRYKPTTYYIRPEEEIKHRSLLEGRVTYTDYHGQQRTLPRHIAFWLALAKTQFADENASIVILHPTDALAVMIEERRLTVSDIAGGRKSRPIAPGRKLR